MFFISLFQGIIKTKDGLKAIEEIKEGDYVYSYNEKTGKGAFKKVLSLSRNVTKKWCTVTILVNGKKEEITSTPGHKYYLPLNNTNRDINEVLEHESYRDLSLNWVSAKDLKSGDKVLLSNGSYGIIDSVIITELQKEEVTYNFEVEDFHTYFVGEYSVCVHNAECGKVKVEDIRYTQDSISSQFSESSGGGYVDDLVENLKNGSVSPNDIPNIRCFEQSGKIYSLDNRRLYAFKTAGIKEVYVDWVSDSVVKSEMWKITTKNGGISIRIRR